MVKKRMKKRKVRTARRSAVKKSSDLGGRKINMVFGRLVFFVVLFVIFLALNALVGNSLWSDFFSIGTLIFGFISAALFIVLLVLWFMKLMKR